MNESQLVTTMTTDVDYAGVEDEVLPQLTQLKIPSIWQVYRRSWILLFQDLLLNDKQRTRAAVRIGRF